VFYQAPPHLLDESDICSNVKASWVYTFLLKVRTEARQSPVLVLATGHPTEEAGLVP
jgi:hypothetical protein